MVIAIMIMATVSYLLSEITKLEFKKNDELRPKRLSTVFFNFFSDACKQTLKTKVGDVAGCIFEVECNVDGFLVLKQIIQGHYK
jgi:hypothetical protein